MCLVYLCAAHFPVFYSFFIFLCPGRCLCEPLVLYACVAFSSVCFCTQNCRTSTALNMDDYTCVKTDDTADKAAATYEALHSTPSPCLTSEHARFDLKGDRVHRCVYNLLPCSRSSKVCLEYEMTAEYLTSYF